MKPIKLIHRCGKQITRCRLGDTALAAVVFIMVLAGNALGLDETEKPECTSPSGKLQFAHYRNNSSVMLYRKSGLSDWRILYSEENGLGVDLPVASASDRLLVISMGGPSYGEHLIILRRNRDGEYRQIKNDISELAWAELVRKRDGMKGARPVHLYSRVISVTEKPDEVTFSMGGDYSPLDGPGQVRLPVAFFRYRVEQQQISMIAQPKGWKLE